MTLLEEVATGSRPSRQLRAVLRADLAERWAQAPVSPGPAGRVVRVARPQVHVRGSTPTAEVVVLVRIGPRTLPTAVRLERRSGRWWATDLERPGRQQAPALPAAWSALLSDEDADVIHSVIVR